MSFSKSVTKHIKHKLSKQILSENPSNRVWKGIFGIWDLTKVHSGIREKAKYFDGIWDFTALQEAGFAKIWARDAGIVFCPSGNREIIAT